MRVITFSVSLGRSSLIQSRAFSVNQYLPVRGSTSPPTELRTPMATTSELPLAGLTRRICDRPLGGRHSLHGGPNGTYSQPALSNARYFQPCGMYLGMSS